MFYFKIIDENTARTYKITACEDKERNLKLILLNEKYKEKELSMQQLFNIFDEYWNKISNKDPEQ